MGYYTDTTLKTQVDKDITIKEKLKTNSFYGHKCNYKTKY